jgi:transposase
VSEGVAVAAGKPLFVGKLSKRDRNRLESSRDASTDAKYRDRCRAILWSAEGKAVPEIAELLDVHRTTAQRWLKDYLRFGLDGLEIGKSTGRPPKVDQEVEAVISRAVHENPRDLGYPFSRWTASTMTAHSAGQNKKVPFFGSLNAATGKVTVDLTPRKRSADFIAHLKQLLRLHRGQHVWMFLDNCSIHNSKVVQRLVADHADQLTLIWNAPYTPELNLIERYWGHLKSTALNNYFFETIEQLENAIRSAVRYLNKKGEAKMNTVVAVTQSVNDAAA